MSSPRSDRGPSPNGSRPRRPDPSLDGRDRFRVALLCSGRAPGLVEWLRLEDERDRPHDLVACLTSDPACHERERLERAGIPCLVHDIRAHYEAAGRPLQDLSARHAYDRGTVERLRPFAPDLLVACGYLHILTEPVLAAYPDRIVNLHDADLTVRGADGGARYPGLHAVREAVFRGAAETRSTAHLVTEEVDGGPPLVLSWAFPVHPLVEEARRWGAEDILKAYAYAHREWMMRASWGPLLRRAVGLFARDAVRALDGRAVVDGGPGPVVLPPPLATLSRIRPEADVPLDALRACGGG